MTNEEFLIEVENSHNRSKKLLIKKAIEYSDNQDRLIQFHKAGVMQDISPAEALMGMAVKHITSILDMVKDPRQYNLRKWNEKITDPYLLDALIREMGVE